MALGPRVAMKTPQTDEGTSIGMSPGWVSGARGSADRVAAIDDDLLLDDDLLPEDDEPARPSAPVEERRRWRVLIVDDDRDVRAITELALKGLRIDDAPVEVLCVDSAEQARRILRERDPIALAIVDVVMESDTAGLEFIEWVRRELGDQAIRLVVRTGQPGSAPETQVMRSYDIHDYLSKTETTSPRLISCVTGAVRAWRDLGTIHRQREGMRRVLRAVDRLFEVSELPLLLRTILDVVVELHAPVARGAALLGPRGLSRDGAARWEVLAATGEYAETVGHDAESFASMTGARIDREGLRAGEVSLRDGCLLYAFDLESALRPVLVCKVESDDPWGVEATALYAHAVTLALRNRRLWERTVADMTRALEERGVLLKEIHHRVKNNLQIVSSLLAMQASKALSAEARAAIVDSELRVRSISLVHQLLYGSRDDLHVHLGDAARALGQAIVESLGRDARIEVQADEVEVSVDCAIPCCLILNELITNAIKHGRSADGGCLVRVVLSADPQTVVLRVEDEGPGLPADFSARRRASLGWRIIESLLQQLRGTMRVSAETGACFEVSFSPGGGPSS